MTAEGSQGKKMMVFIAQQLANYTNITGSAYTVQPVVVFRTVDDG